MRDTPAGRHEPLRYEIRFQGHLAPRWATRFDGMTLTAHDDGTTVLGGPVVDQAALHGLLAQLRDTGLPLISVTPMPSEMQTPTTAPPPAPAPAPAPEGA